MRSGDPNSAPFFSAAAIPLELVIDARTMQLLSVEVGFGSDEENAIKAQIP